MELIQSRQERARRGLVSKRTRSPLRVFKRRALVVEMQILLMLVSAWWGHSGPAGTGGTIYAGPSSLANASGFGITARTGLLPSQATSVVTLPEAAASAFRVPAVVGPFTAWQRLSGTVYTAGAGTIDLTTGVFTRVGPATNQLFIYGLDATTTTALHVGPALAGLDDPNNPTSGVSTNVLPTSDSVVVVGPGLLDLSSAPNNPSSFALTLTGNTPGAASVNGIGLTQEEIAAQQCLVPQPPNLTQ